MNIYILYIIYTMHVATSVSPLVRPHRQMRRGVRSGAFKRLSKRGKAWPLADVDLENSPRD